VTFIKIRSRRRKFSNSDIVEQKSNIKKETIYLPLVDIKSWDVQKFFIVYQTLALLQIVRLTIVTLTSHLCNQLLPRGVSMFFLLPTCFGHQKNPFCE
jgi:hypothetical protein